jgi:hypothetical protein
MHHTQSNTLMANVTVSGTLAIDLRWRALAYIDFHAQKLRVTQDMKLAAVDAVLSDTGACRHIVRQLDDAFGSGVEQITVSGPVDVLHRIAEDAVMDLGEIATPGTYAPAFNWYPAPELAGEHAAAEACAGYMRMRIEIGS